MWPRRVLYFEALHGEGSSREELRMISVRFRLRRCIARCVAMIKGTGGINESTLEVMDDGVNRMLTAKLVLALAAVMTKFEVSSTLYKSMLTAEALIRANLKIEDSGAECMGAVKIRCLRSLAGSCRK